MPSPSANNPGLFFDYGAAICTNNCYDNVMIVRFIDPQSPLLYPPQFLILNCINYDPTPDIKAYCLVQNLRTDNIEPIVEVKSQDGYSKKYSIRNDGKEQQISLYPSA